MTEQLQVTFNFGSSKWENVSAISQNRVSTLVLFLALLVLLPVLLVPFLVLLVFLEFPVLRGQLVLLGPPDRRDPLAFFPVIHCSQLLLLIIP